jgi:fructose-1,6-bisphosphatase II / sedoheptulose-1,7-bisphosphatase
MSVMSDELALAAARAPMAAAIAAARFAGLGDEIAIDQAAVEAMRNALNAMTIDGHIVIGEGEREEAEKLYVGEGVGTGEGPALDIAVDPIEGTTLAAKAQAGALAVIALAPRGGLLRTPTMAYMEKIAIGQGYAPGVVDLDKPVADNVKALAKAKGVKPEAIGVCVLDRPRHGGVIEALRSVGARVHLIGDGDIAGVINCTKPETGIDMYLGTGGAPEGVLAAAALKCVGGQFQGRLVLRSEEERAQAERAGIKDPKQRFELDDLVSKEAIFVAVGVTSGSLLDGVRFGRDVVQTSALVLNSATRTAAELRVRQPI